MCVSVSVGRKRRRRGGSLTHSLSHECGREIACLSACSLASLAASLPAALSFGLSANGGCSIVWAPTSLSLSLPPLSFTSFCRDVPREEEQETAAEAEAAAHEREPNHRTVRNKA